MDDAYFETRFRAEASIEWPRHFMILSACATPGEHWTEAENAAADQRLKTVLDGWECWHRRVLAHAPGAEEQAAQSWAAELSREAALAIGRDFLQDAIYEVEDEELWVIDCDNPVVREFVGRFAERLDAPTG